MRKSIWVIPAVLIALALSGCQLINPTTPPPTASPVYLAPAASATPIAATPAPAEAPAAASRNAAPAPTSTPRPPAAPPATAATRLLALGIRPTVALRSAPEATASALATVNGSQILWAEGRTADGQWLRVTYGAAGSRGWAAASDVRLTGKADSLPVVAAEVIAPVAAVTPGAGKVELAGRVIVAQLNVRGGPGLDQPVIGQLTAGARVAVIGRADKGDWLAIRWPIGAATGAAWVAAGLLEVAGPVADLPILAAQTTGAAASVPALTGKIAFQTRTGGDIYVINADGSALRRVATGLDPAFSPDGTRLAYARWDAPHGVFVLDLATGQEQRVASANRPRSPTWSDDGSKLVFAHSTRDYVCLETPLGCYDEATIRQVFGGQDCMDTPQGRFCISDFPERRVEDTGLAQVTMADRGWLDLLSGPTAQSPAWRPGENTVLFRSKVGLQVFAPGGEVRSLVENVELGSPAWSPDGQRIAAQIYLHDHADIFLLDASGKTQKRLTAPPQGYKRAPNNVAPAWSPDGQTLLFLSDRDGAWRLYRMAADGANQALFLPDVLGGLTLSYDFAAERVVSWGR
jgi:Tol biopolymer transport system component